MPEDEISKLKEENEKLKMDNSLKSDVVSTSAHQMRTSLSAIKWVMKMLLDHDAGPLSSEQESLLKKAYESNERMIEIVNTLLDANHIEDVMKEFKPIKIDVLQLIEKVLFEFWSETKKRGIEIILLKPESSTSAVLADQAKMRIVLQNLIENSIKYSKDNSKIFVSISEADGKVKVGIKDTGIGIPEESAPHIFDKFYRAPNAKTLVTIGSGLGLFTTKQIVEKHGGTIWFESGKDDGTTFYFTVPIA